MTEQTVMEAKAQNTSEELQIAGGSSTEAKLIALLNPMIEALGYEVVHLETILQRHKVLRIFIDFIEHQPGVAIGIQDCVKVTKALDEPLETHPVIDAVFKGPYELEVSSPGVDRPLRQGKDFERFQGREVRIHVFRPLSAEEIGNTQYLQKNPKQKNFVGRLQGLNGSNVLLAIAKGGAGDSKKGKAAKKGAKKASSAEPDTNSAEEVRIPLPLISKANLEPVFEFDHEAEAELDIETSPPQKKASK